MLRTILIALFCMFSSTPHAAADVPAVDRIRLPPGFAIEVFAYPVPNARAMALGDDGTLFVGSRRAGNVYAVSTAGGRGRTGRVRVIARDLKLPSGVAFRGGSLYVGEVNRVIRFDDIEKRLDDPPDAVVVNDSLPEDLHHGWKFIGFGPDGRLYVPVGAPCNVCERKDPRYGALLRMHPDGTGLEIFAKGIRNTVGFDWHPETHELWFTDNGRDMLGDDRPPDELNRAPEKGLHFGFPYCHGGDITDPEFGEKRLCGEFTPPATRLGPHVASLGMRFYTGRMFPASYRGQIFIAEHGSWNRSTKIGYRISLVRLEGNEAVTYETFASGWLEGEDVWGRPADVLVMPDGALLVSDDYAGAIYRIAYAGDRQ